MVTEKTLSNGLTSQPNEKILELYARLAYTYGHIHTHMLNVSPIIKHNNSARDRKKEEENETL